MLGLRFLVSKALRFRIRLRIDGLSHKTVGWLEWLKVCEISYDARFSLTV